MVDIPTMSLQSYAPVVGEGILREIRLLASHLLGARVQHVNSTAEGGGVAELLAMLVPLMRDVGLEATWDVMRGSKSFFEVTKVLHNNLHGDHHAATAAPTGKLLPDGKCARCLSFPRSGGLELLAVNSHRGSSPRPRTRKALGNLRAFRLWHCRFRVAISRAGYRVYPSVKVRGLTRRAVSGFACLGAGLTCVPAA